jgi:hypothetical protein
MCIKNATGYFKEVQNQTLLKSKFKNKKIMVNFLTENYCIFSEINNIFNFINKNE